ncbi:MAG: hypothetical protein DHS20C18_55430 [Saprospiraceae bacterium]|nr:MAG: hypothetical protein DHS20C18_55430 [Saprospiraceae bacterium]
MRNLIYSLLIILSLGTFSCQQNNAETTKAKSAFANIPELLDRNPGLQNGKEWEQVQNVYVKNRNKIAANADDGEGRLNLALLFINEARVTGEHGHYYPSALQVLNELLENPIENKDLKFRALSAKASVQLSQHDFTNALISGEEAVALNPYNAQIYGVLVDANVELGNYEEAVAIADKMVSIRPDLRSYARVSYLREIYGKVEGAIEAMDMAVAAGYPGFEQTCWARLTLGKLHEQYGDKKLAEYQFQMALQERENYPFALAEIAALRMKDGNYEEAEELLNQACKLIPEVHFYIHLADIYKATNRPEKFQETIKEIKLMLEDDVVHGHNMNLEYAHLYKDQIGDLNEALVYAKKEYEKRPQNIDVNRLLAQIYHDMGNETAAATHFAVAARTNSQNPELTDLKQQLATL